MALQIIAYPFGGSTPIAFSPLVAADFVNVAPFTDPNAILNNPISIHANNGEITFDLAQPGTARDGLAEGALWRLNWPAGWTGDGTQALICRITAMTNPGVTSSPLFCIGYCDQGGDPADATPARCEAHGVGFVDALNVGNARMGATSGADLNGAPFANTPIAYTMWIPGGVVGDETNVGATSATGGGSMSFNWDSTLKTAIGTLYNGDAGVVTNGIYPVLGVGFDSTGAGNITVTVKFEWTIIPIMPAGTF